MTQLSTLHTELRLPTEVKNKNILKSFYNSFEDRTVNLSKHIISCIDKQMSKALNTLVYDWRALESKMSSGVWETVSDIGYNERYFQGVYKLEFIEHFIGVIPMINQEELIYKYNIIKSNPLLEKQSFGLLVLAPVNNFATTANVIAIDPIVFCKLKIKQKDYLIPLTQW